MPPCSLDAVFWHPASSTVPTSGSMLGYAPFPGVWGVVLRRIVQKPGHTQKLVPMPSLLTVAFWTKMHSQMHRCNMILCRRCCPCRSGMPCCGLAGWLGYMACWLGVLAGCRTLEQQYVLLRPTASLGFPQNVNNTHGMCVQLCAWIAGRHLCARIAVCMGCSLAAACMQGWVHARLCPLSCVHGLHSLCPCRCVHGLVCALASVLASFNKLQPEEGMGDLLSCAWVGFARRASFRGSFYLGHAWYLT